MRVLDASVVIKWFKPDEKSEAVDLLLESHLAGEEIIFVPTLLLYEFANVLFFSKKLTSDEITGAVERLFQSRINFIPPDLELSSSALALAETAKISVYDASYVALADHLQCPLITADTKLYRSAHAIADIRLL